MSGLLLGSPALASAAGAFPPQTGTGSVGLEGTISTAPPTRGATITTPANGSTFTQLPVTVNGLCPTGLLVKIFANNIFVGSAFCANGSYSIQVDLFSGQNDLVVRVYDALDQAGPDSNVVNVTFVSAQFAVPGSQLILTSNYAEEGANPGDEIQWPIIVSGGTGPYAISADWGDNSPLELISSSFSGQIILKHTYKTAGIYKVIVKATDSKGNEALLQLTGVANGASQQNAGTSKSNGNPSSITITKVLWWPALAMLPLIGAAFWVGRRYELYVLRKQLEKSRSQA